VNERIQELANQMFSMEQFEYAEEFLNDEFLEKFAELIVRECAGISEQHNRNYYTSHGQIIANKIKEHFGVEE